MILFVDRRAARVVVRLLRSAATMLNGHQGGADRRWTMPRRPRAHGARHAVGRAVALPRALDIADDGACSGPTCLRYAFWPAVGHFGPTPPRSELPPQEKLGAIKQQYTTFRDIRRPSSLSRTDVCQFFEFLIIFVSDCAEIVRPADVERFLIAK